MPLPPRSEVQPLARGRPRHGFRVPLLSFVVVLVALGACANPPSSSPDAQGDPAAASTGEVSPRRTPTAVATATVRPSPTPARTPGATTTPLDTQPVQPSPTAAPTPPGTEVPETGPAKTATATSLPSPGPVPTAVAVTPPSPTAVPSPSPTPSQTPTPSASPAPPATATAVPTATQTATPLPTPSPTPTPEPTATQTPEPTPSPTATPPPLQANVEILCIFYDGEVYQTEKDEYVEIANLGSGPQDLAGWRLVDIYDEPQDKSQSYDFVASYVLESGASIRVYTDEIHLEWGGFSFGRGSAVWANGTPDTAGLFDESGLLISQKSYPPGC